MTCGNPWQGRGRVIALGWGSRASAAILTRFGGILRFGGMLAECLQNLPKDLGSSLLTRWERKRIVISARPIANRSPGRRDGNIRASAHRSGQQGEIPVELHRGNPSKQDSAKGTPMRAIVIGAGISGPAASIALAISGHKVTVHEARTEQELASDGVLGITPDNFTKLTAMGVDLASRELLNTFTEYDTGETRYSSYHYITWTDLHWALVQRASELGVTFRYGHKITGTPNADIIVRATGVGTAKEVSVPEYTGYVVVRGMATKLSGTPWTTVRGESTSGKWLFNIGDTRDGASFEFFVARPQAFKRTTYSAVAPKETLDLPSEFQSLVTMAPIFQTAPLSDWEVPSEIKRGNEIRIGDANGQLRPQTSMGANLGIAEAIETPLLASDTRASDNAEQILIGQRQRYYAMGKLAGIQRGKFGK